MFRRFFHIQSFSTLQPLTHWYTMYQCVNCKPMSSFYTINIKDIILLLEESLPIFSDYEGLVYVWHLNLTVLNCPIFKPMVWFLCFQHDGNAEWFFGWVWYFFLRGYKCRYWNKIFNQVKTFKVNSLKANHFRISRLLPRWMTGIHFRQLHKMIHSMREYSCKPALLQLPRVKLFKPEKLSMSFSSMIMERQCLQLQLWPLTFLWQMTIPTSTSSKISLSLTRRTSWWTRSRLSFRSRMLLLELLLHLELRPGNTWETLPSGLILNCGWRNMATAHTRRTTNTSMSRQCQNLPSLPLWQVCKCSTDLYHAVNCRCFILKLVLGLSLHDEKKYGLLMYLRRTNPMYSHVHVDR